MTSSERTVLDRLEDKVDKIDGKIDAWGVRIVALETSDAVRLALAKQASGQRQGVKWAFQLLGDWSLRLIGLVFVAMQILGLGIRT